MRKYGSKTLSRWGKLGGRPKKYSSSAERKRAYRLRQKQLNHGSEATLREYRNVSEISKNSFYHGKCDNCHSQIWGSFKIFSSQCLSCHAGNYQSAEFATKRAMTDAERQRISRISKKIDEGRPLRPEDREFLKSINKDYLAEID